MTARRKRKSPEAPRYATRFPPMDEPQSFIASIADGLRDLGLCRLRNGDEVGAQRLLYGAETLRQQAECEVSATDDRLAELREFARAFSGELTEANDLAEDVEHTYVPDDYATYTDPTDLVDLVRDLVSEVKALRKVESTYASFRKVLGRLSDKYCIEDEL